jgi:hypothetical protein
MCRDEREAKVVAQRDRLAEALEGFRLGDIEVAGLERETVDCWSAALVRANRLLREIEEAP